MLYNYSIWPAGNHLASEHIHRAPTWSTARLALRIKLETRLTEPNKVWSILPLTMQKRALDFGCYFTAATAQRKNYEE